MFSETIQKRVLQRQLEMPSVAGKLAFLGNLIFCYQYMVASHNLALVAARNSEGALHEYFKKHAEEEKNHAEWLRADLSTEGADVNEMPLSLYAQCMVGTQYYNIFHDHPASLLGYMALLEMNPMSLAQIEKLEAMYGKPLLRTLRFHAEHDLDHAKDLKDILDTLPDTLHSIVVDSLNRTADYMHAALNLLTFKEPQHAH